MQCFHFRPLSRILVFGGNGYTRPATGHGIAWQKSSLVTMTHTGSYMDMQTPTELPSCYHDNIPVNHDFSHPENIHWHGESKSYHLSVCLFSFGTTLIRFHISPPTYTHSVSIQTYTLQIYASQTSTHIPTLYWPTQLFNKNIDKLLNF